MELMEFIEQSRTCRHIHRQTHSASIAPPPPFCHAVVVGMVFGLGGRLVFLGGGGGPRVCVPKMAPKNLFPF